MQQQQPGSGTAPIILGVILSVLTLVKLGLQVWGLNKGFDITDEGLYILMLNFSDQYPTEPHNYYTYIVKALLPLQNYGLLMLRWLSLVFEITGITYFALSVHYWLSHRYVNAPELGINKYILVIFTFLMAAFISVYPRAFSYNDLSYFNTLLVSGTVLRLFTGSELSFKLKKVSTQLILFVLGAVIGAQVIIKFSTSILLLAWVPAYLLLYYRTQWKQVLSVPFTMLLGSVAFWAVFFKGPDGFFTWYHNLLEGIRLLKQLSYDPYGVLVQGYLTVDIIDNSQYYVLPLLSAFTAQWLLKRTTALSISWRRFVTYLVGLAVWLAWSLTIPQYHLGQFYYRFIAVHIYTLLFFVLPIIKKQISKKRWHETGMVILFMALPVISLMGSNNPMTQTLTRYLGPWAVLVFIILHQRIKDRMVSFLFIGSIVAVTFVNYVTTQIYNPYALPHPLTEQNTPIDEQHYVHDIEVDDITANMFGQLTNIAKSAGYQPGGPVLALGDICGVATALGGYIPETFWYFSDKSATSPQHARNYSCLHLNNLQISEHKRLPLIVISQTTHQQVLECLTQSQIPYPENYHSVGEVYSPYRQEKLFILAPNNWIP